MFAGVTACRSYRYISSCARGFLGTVLLRIHVACGCHMVFAASHSMAYAGTYLWCSAGIASATCCACSALLCLAVLCTGVGFVDFLLDGSSYQSRITPSMRDRLGIGPADGVAVVLKPSSGNGGGSTGGSSSGGGSGGTSGSGGSSRSSRARVRLRQRVKLPPLRLGECDAGPDAGCTSSCRNGQQLPCSKRANDR